MKEQIQLPKALKAGAAWVVVVGTVDPVILDALVQTTTPILILEPDPVRAQRLVKEWEERPTIIVQEELITDRIQEVCWYRYSDPRRNGLKPPQLVKSLAPNVQLEGLDQRTARPLENVLQGWCPEGDGLLLIGGNSAAVDEVLGGAGSWLNRLESVLLMAGTTEKNEAVEAVVKAGLFNRIDTHSGWQHWQRDRELVVRAQLSLAIADRDGLAVQLGELENQQMILVAERDQLAAQLDQLIVERDKLLARIGDLEGQQSAQNLAMASIQSAGETAQSRGPRKTLKGKNGYLFLINDSNQELDSHLLGKDPNAEARRKRRYEQFNSPIFVLVIPDKSIICREKLPTAPEIMHRPGLDAYKKISNIQVIDPSQSLLPSDYYKTDTHINLKGLLKCFLKATSCMDIAGIKPIDAIELNSIKMQLSNSGRGLGDLTWETNKMELILEEHELMDRYYSSPQIKEYYLNPLKLLGDARILKYDLSDITHLKNMEDTLDWQIISENILLLKNDSLSDNPLKCLVFYDSSSIPLIDLVKTISHKTYFVKSEFDLDIANSIAPDHVFEIRTERFM